MSETSPEQSRHFFVDEAGDLTLFNKQGEISIGQEGVSTCFMVGYAMLPNPAQVKRTLDALRADLLADPRFRGVPSMQPGRKKTAVAFHAKDDLSTIRQEVFKLLPTFGAKVTVAVRRKAQIVRDAEMLKAKDKGMLADAIYDDLVKRIFKNPLHKVQENHIIFARRGKSKRTDALEEAIAKARRNFAKSSGITSASNVYVDALYPSQSAGLQVIDYYLWALQRCYEKGEAEYFNLLKDGYSLIMDIDDKRNHKYGEYYRKKRNILTPEKIKLDEG